MELITAGTPCTKNLGYPKTSSAYPGPSFFAISEAIFNISP